MDITLDLLFFVAGFGEKDSVTYRPSESEFRSGNENGMEEYQLINNKFSVTGDFYLVKLY